MPKDVLKRGAFPHGKPANAVATFLDAPARSIRFDFKKESNIPHHQFFLSGIAQYVEFHFSVGEVLVQVLNKSSWMQKAVERKKNKAFTVASE